MLNWSNIVRMTVNQARAETVTAGLCGVLAVWDGGKSSYRSYSLLFSTTISGVNNTPAARRAGGRSCLSLSAAVGVRMKS